MGGPRWETPRPVRKEPVVGGACGGRGGCGIGGSLRWEEPVMGGALLGGAAPLLCTGWSMCQVTGPCLAPRFLRGIPRSALGLGG